MSAPAVLNNSSAASKELAATEDAVHLAQDGLLGALYPGEFINLAAFVKHSTRLQSVLTPHIVALLTKGVSVVLDFPGNMRRQRAWFRQLIEMSGCDHELHSIVASDELCKRQLKQRSQELGLPRGAKWTTEADFEEVTAYFDPPSVDEGFNVIRHERHTCSAVGSASSASGWRTICDTWSNFVALSRITTIPHVIKTFRAISRSPVTEESAFIRVFPCAVANGKLGG